LSTQADRAFAAETLGQLSNTLGTLLLTQQDDLTSVEATYYEFLSTVCLLNDLCSNVRPSTDPDPVTLQLLDAIEAGLSGLRAYLPTPRNEGIGHMIAITRSMLTIGMCREAASMVQIATKMLHVSLEQSNEQSNNLRSRH
jgi:hypothetical protein